MSDSRRLPRRVVVGSGIRLLGRPGLWATALGAAFRMAPSRWWRRWPPLPLPDRAYLSFRLTTAYGDDLSVARSGDLVTYLEWRRDFLRSLD